MSYYRQPPTRAYGSGVPFGLPPVTQVVRSLMIACGAIWLVQFTLDSILGVWDPSLWFGVVPQRVLSGWIWQPFTYMFLHSTGNMFHLIMNLFFLYMVGGDLERHWGAHRFLRYFLICGVGAGLFVTAAGWISGTNAPTIGASGAIYGLLLAFGTIFADRVFLFMFIFPIRARTLSWILFAVAFLSTWDPRPGGVSHVAHLGGMVVGYLYLKRAWRVSEFYRELRWRVRRRKFRVMPPKDEDRWIH